MPKKPEPPKSGVLSDDYAEQFAGAIQGRIDRSLAPLKKEIAALKGRATTSGNSASRVFQQGDTVMLAGGGVPMKVLSTANNRNILTCGWFFRNHKGDFVSYEREQFPPKCLELLKAYEG